MLLAMSLILLGISAGGFFLKGVLPSTVTITSMGASQKPCVEADFGGQVDADCLDKAGTITLSSRMKRDGVIYLTLKHGREVPKRSELVYAGRNFGMHCDITINKDGDLDKRCRKLSYADLFH